MVKCRVVSRVQETQSLVGMAVSGAMRLLCACGGVMDSKEVVVAEGGGEYCLLAAAACIHGKQIWFFSDFSYWRSQLFSLSSSNSPLPLHSESLMTKGENKIRCSDVPSSFFSFFFISHLAFAIQMWPWHVIEVAQSYQSRNLCYVEWWLQISLGGYFGWANLIRLHQWGC